MWFPSLHFCWGAFLCLGCTRSPFSVCLILLLLHRSVKSFLLHEASTPWPPSLAGAILSAPVTALSPSSFLPLAMSGPYLVWWTCRCAPRFPFQERVGSAGSPQLAISSQCRTRGSLGPCFTGAETSHTLHSRCRLSVGFQRTQCGMVVNIHVESRAGVQCLNSSSHAAHSYIAQNYIWMMNEAEDRPVFYEILFFSEYISALHWMFASPTSEFTGWILPPKWQCWEVGAFRRWWGHEGGALMMGLVSLQKTFQTAPSPLLPCEDTVRRHRLWTRKQVLNRHQIYLCLDLRLPASRTVRNECLLCISYQTTTSTLLWLPERTRTINKYE